MRTPIALLLLGSLTLTLTLTLTASAAPPPEPTFRSVEIDGNIQIGYGLALADVDGDGKTDVVLVDKHQVAWYQNPSWKKHVIAENLTAHDHVCIAARDIDGDGKAEIAVGAEWNPGDTVNSGAVFYLKPPADRTARWEPVRLPHEPTTHRMRWVRSWPDGFNLVVVPLHGRGNQGGKGEGVRILSYRMPESAGGEWTTRLVDDSLHMTHNFDPVQWDDDEPDEFLIGGREGVFLSNWREGGSFLTKIAGDANGGAGEVRLGRVGGQPVIGAIEPMHGNSFVVFSRPESGGEDALWTRKVLDDSLVDGHAVAAGDLLGTGSDQFVVGWRAMRGGARVGIKLFTPLDDKAGAWRTSLLDDNKMACEDLQLADLDGDGRLDIAAAGRATKNVILYFNETGE